jgi:cell division ATPase FtsA
VKGVQYYTNKIHCGVVLTGGSAYLNDIDVLFSRELKMQVRLGSVFNGIDDDSQEKVSFPNAAVVGLLNYGSKHKPCDVIPQFPRVVKQQPVTPPEPPQG